MFFASVVSIKALHHRLTPVTSLLRSHFRQTSTTSSSSISVTVIGRDGQHRQLKAEIGDTLLTFADKNALDVPGTCGGCCECSTCHMYISPPHILESLSPADDDEMDLLDSAADVRDNSRLGCQLDVRPTMDGMVITLPKRVIDLYKNK